MVVLPCRPLPPRTYLHTNWDATPPPATPRCRVGGLASASGPLAFLPVDHGLGAHNGLHPMEVISPGRANGPLWKGSDACGVSRRPRPATASRPGPARLVIRFCTGAQVEPPKGSVPVAGLILRRVTYVDVR